MNKRLIFICPTDFLETTINKAFKGENYFVTSLGNSITFDHDKLEEINALIEKKGIEEILFILSDDNRIFLDAFGKQKFTKIAGLNNFYREIISKKIYSLIQSPIDTSTCSFLSYYLDIKINELRPKLSNCFVDRIKFNTKVYCRQKGIFNQTNFELFNLQNRLN